LDNRELVACAVSPAHVSGMPRSEEEEGKHIAGDLATHELGLVLELVLDSSQP